MELLLGLLLTVILGIVHFFGEQINEKLIAPASIITSFSAGISVSYVFLMLLPELHKGFGQFGDYTFLFAMVGFAGVHMIEKAIYRHEKTLEDIKRDFKELHSVFLFIYHLGMGTVLFYILRTSPLEGTLFFIPLLLHTAISSLSLKELNEDVLDITSVKILISVSGVAGVLIASFTGVSFGQFHVILGIITGMFLHVVISDSMEAEAKGETWSFLLGIILYSLLIISLWTFL